MHHLGAKEMLKNGKKKFLLGKDSKKSGGCGQLNERVEESTG